MARGASSGRSSDVAIADLLREEGFSGSAAARARAVLEEAGLTHAGKSRLAVEKLERARALLRGRLMPLCAACAGLADPAGREVVEARAVDCALCRGSANRRAGLAAQQALRRARRGHVLVLGGSPSTQAALQEHLAGPGVEVRSITGTQGPRPRASVEADVAWADFVLVWASTPLPHKVSVPYTDRARETRVPLVTVARRGVEAVCQAIVQAFPPRARA